MSNEKQLSGKVICGSPFGNEPHDRTVHCHNPRPASPALVEGERQELLGKEGGGAELRGWLAGREAAASLAVSFATFCSSRVGAGAVSSVSVAIRALSPPAALTEQQPRAAPPISLEEQIAQLTDAASDLRARLEKLTLEQAAKAQPDAQDLTEEEIEAFDNFIWHEADQESCARWKHIYAEVKRRRGIK